MKKVKLKFKSRKEMYNEVMDYTEILNEQIVLMKRRISQFEEYVRILRNNLVEDDKLLF